MNVKVEIVDWTTNASNMQRGTGDWNVSTTASARPLLGPQQWRPMIYTFPQVEGHKGWTRPTTILHLARRRRTQGRLADSIQKEVLDGAYMIKIADAAGSTAIARSSRPERLAGVLQLLGPGLRLMARWPAEEVSDTPRGLEIAAGRAGHRDRLDPGISAAAPAARRSRQWSSPASRRPPRRSNGAQATRARSAVPRPARDLARPSGAGRFRPVADAEPERASRPSSNGCRSRCRWRAVAFLITIPVGVLLGMRRGLLPQHLDRLARDGRRAARGVDPELLDRHPLR